MENNWKELEIGNIPSDFYTNEFLDIENRWKCGEWLQSNNIHVIDRWEIIKNLLTDKNFEYRYRLKPLEPIRITRDLAGFLYDSDKLELEAYCDNAVFDDDNQLIECDGRPVEIID